MSRKLLMTEDEEKAYKNANSNPDGWRNVIVSIHKQARDRGLCGLVIVHRDGTPLLACDGGIVGEPKYGPSWFGLAPPAPADPAP